VGGALIRCPEEEEEVAAVGGAPNFPPVRTGPSPKGPEGDREDGGWAPDTAAAAATPEASGASDMLLLLEA